MQVLKRRLLFVLVCLMLVAGTAVATDNFVVPEIDYATFTLDNGLEVFVIEDDSVPLVDVSIYYNVGSIDEPQGKTGISHFLEHTMFLGTESLGKGMVEQLISSVGGNYNAMTSNDLTFYYFQVPSSKLELAMAIEADRMNNLKIDPVDIEREREVIKQERRGSLENDVFSAALEQVQAVAFPNSSLGHQVVGHMEDLNNITAADLQAYYKNYYCPSNAVLVVTGDAKLAEVKQLTEKYFSGYAAGNVVRPEVNITPLESEVVFEIPANSSIPISVMIYRTAQGNDPDIMAISVFLNILINNQSSRVKQELLQKQLIIETGGFPFEIRVPGYALLYTVPMSIDHLPIAQQAFDAEIEKIIADGVTQEELNIVKKAVMKTMIMSQKDPASMASSIAVGALQYGQPNMLQEQIEYLNNLTVEDIQAVAAKYFQPDNRVLGNVIPVN